jgi:hypothetical protein
VCQPGTNPGKGRKTDREILFLSEQSFTRSETADYIVGTACRGSPGEMLEEVLVDSGSTRSASGLLAFFRKRSTVYGLLFANLCVPAVFLIAGFVHTRTPAPAAEVPSLFSSPNASWVDLMSDSETEVSANTLAPVLYATFPSEILPETLVLSDGSGRNLRDEVLFWGGKAEVTSKQFLFAPEFDFYPGSLIFDLSYQTVGGETRHFEKHINLTFEEDFSRPLDRRFWMMQQGITPRRWHDVDVVSLEPGDREKSALVFSKSYRNNAQVVVQFIPASTTPNLSVSFNERTAFIIGDGRDDQVRFKHGLVLANAPNRYFHQEWSIHPLKAGEMYTVQIGRAATNYSLVLTDAHGTVLFSVSFSDDDKTRAFEERFPLISVWVFRNNRSSVVAETYLHRMTVFFPSL